MNFKLNTDTSARSHCPVRMVTAGTLNLQMILIPGLARSSAVKNKRQPATCSGSRSSTQKTSSSGLVFPCCVLGADFPPATNVPRWGNCTRIPRSQSFLTARRTVSRCTSKIPANCRSEMSFCPGVKPLSAIWRTIAVIIASCFFRDLLPGHLYFI